MARTARSRTTTVEDLAKENEETLSKDEASADEETAPLEAAPNQHRTIKVQGRCALAKHPDGVAYGHWRAGIHWPASEQLEAEVTVKQLDELLSDPNLALIFDKGEAALARAAEADNKESKEIALAAAEAEVTAKVLRAQQTAAEAQEAAARAVVEANAARSRLQALRT
jgi:hypothetical protein